MSGSEDDGRLVSSLRALLIRRRPSRGEMIARVRRAAKPVAGTVLVVAAMSATARTSVALLVVAVVVLARRRTRRRRLRTGMERDGE